MCEFGGASDVGIAVHPDVPRMEVTLAFSLTLRSADEADVTPAVYPRLSESHHIDIQSTGQKSHCVSNHQVHRNALF